jgi:hypothetical protein
MENDQVLAQGKLAVLKAGPVDMKSTDNLRAEAYEHVSAKYFKAMIFWTLSTAIAVWTAGWWGFIGLALALRSLVMAVVSWRRAEILRDDG